MEASSETKHSEIFTVCLNSCPHGYTKTEIDNGMCAEYCETVTEKIERDEGVRQALSLVIPFVQVQIDNYPGEYDNEYIEETEKPLQEAVKVLNEFLAGLYL